jgi:subtilisin family serine protease
MIPVLPRRIAYAIIYFFLTFAMSASTIRAQEAPPSDAEAYAARVPGVVYVQFREGYSPFAVAKKSSVVKESDPVKKLFAEIGVTSIDAFDPNAWKDPVLHQVGFDRVYVVNYSSNAHPLSVVLRLLQTGLVQTASPRYIFKLQSIPNDPQFGDQYYMQKIEAAAGWDAMGGSRGDSNVIIADVDAGVNYNHEDLKGNIKINPGETGLDAQNNPKQSNGRDDDGDGYIDDWRGWDAAGNVTTFSLRPDNDPYPSMIAAGIANEATHGTMTTGCFGAVADNGLGISGVAPGCKVVPVKIGNDYEQLTGAYEGIYYASNYLAKHATRGVINNSWGGRSDAEALPFGAIFQQMITARGQVCVASAGNYRLNNDVTPFYPACVPGVLSVGATDQNDRASSFTHYGKSVLVYAPGVGIRTTEYDFPAQNNEYTTAPDVDGTSFSGPIVSGVVGLVMSKFPKLSPDAVKKRIIDACDPVVGHANDPLYHGRVNAKNALIAPVTPALAIQSFKVNGADDGTLGPINSSNTIEVTFINSSRAGSSLTGVIIDGPGYKSNGINGIIGNIGELETRSANFTITRTGEFSEGTIPVYVAVKDGGAYHDTLHFQVPLSKIPGMTHALLVQHGTAIKQVDAVNGWAGFGFHLEIHDIEKNQDTEILINQYAQRTANGWQPPVDFGTDDTVTTVEAIDADHVWFGGGDLNGGFVVHYSVDGGNSWNTSNPAMNIRTMHFTDAMHGTAIGDANGGKWQMKTTSNGGQSWDDATSVNSTTPSEKTFYSDACWIGTDGWFGTDNGEIVSTYADARHRWTVHSLNTNLKNITAIAIAADVKLGFAAAHGATGDSLFYTLNGVTWQRYANGPPGFSPYAIAFIPGTDTAIITSNMGVFKIGSPNDKVLEHYLPAPASWDAHRSFISVSGISGLCTIAANSDPSGVADYQVGGASSVSAKDEQNNFSFTTAPNPFTTSTMIYFTMSRTEHAHIRVADVLGRTVAEVFDGSLSEGPHAIQVTAADLLPGVYHCVIETQSGDRAERSIVLTR